MSIPHEVKDRLRTLLWCNWKRIKAFKLPLLWMPKYDLLSLRITQGCPVARALPGTVSVGSRDYVSLPKHGNPHIVPLPAYVRRYVSYIDGAALADLSTPSPDCERSHP